MQNHRRFDGRHNAADLEHDVPRAISPASTARSSPGFEILDVAHLSTRVASNASPAQERVKPSEPLSPHLSSQEPPAHHTQPQEGDTSLKHAHSSDFRGSASNLSLADHIMQDRDSPNEHLTVDSTLSTGLNPDVASIVPSTRSYATTPASDDLHTATDRSPSPLTSDQDSLDAFHISNTLLDTAPKPSDEVDGSTILSQRKSGPAAVLTNDQSPSRRSARIVSSGSSVQKALMRRDELDDKLMGKTPTSSTPSSSQSSIIQVVTPPRRGRGRPRKYPLTPLSASTVVSSSPLATQVSPIRRGPGRPRKYPLLPSASPVTADEPVIAERESPVRRGRGRPRKSAQILMQSGPSKVLPRSTQTAVSPTAPLRRQPLRARRSAPMLTSLFAAARTPAPTSHASPPRRSPGRPSKIPKFVYSSSAATTSKANSAPFKRLPGRPRKSAPAMIQSIQPVAAAQPAPAMDTPVKRGPGRPRKYPLIPPVTPTSTMQAYTSTTQSSQNLSQVSPIRRGPGRPRKSAPSTLAGSTMPLAVRALHRRNTTPNGRRSSRLSAKIVDPQLTTKVIASPPAPPPAPPLAASAPTSPLKRGPGRPRRSVLNDVVSPTAPRQTLAPTASKPPSTPITSKQTSTPTQSKQPSTLAKTLEQSSTPAGVRRAASVKRTASEAFPTAAEPPKRKRGRPFGPERLRRLQEEEERARVRNELDRSQSEMLELSDGGTSDLTDLSDDADDAARSSIAATSITAAEGAAKKAKRISRQDKDKKKYYVTGLYAGESDAHSSTPIPHVTVFPQPLHFGSRLLTEERDYELPFQLHQESEQLRARADAKRKPPPYQQIKSNKYTSRPKLQGEITVCYCKPPSNCGSDCMNRMTLFICDPKSCPCGEACTNISLGKRTAVNTTVAHYGGRGFGLKTLEPIAMGQFIDEYRGEVINLTEMTKRVNEEYMATGNFYLLEYDAAAGELLDGGRKGNVTRFANHSCDPNCRIEKFTICGTDESLSAEFQIGLFALRDIEAGEELTYNYGWAAFQPRDINGVPTTEVPPMNCLCGATNCVGILGGKKVPPTKPGESSIVGRKTKKKRRSKALTPKAAASLLTQVTQKQNEAGNSGLSRKVGVRETRRRTAETAIKLAVKVKLKRAARLQPLTQNPAAELPPVEAALPLSDYDEEITEEQPRPIVRKRGRPPKTPSVASFDIIASTNLSTGRPSRSSGYFSAQTNEPGPSHVIQVTPDRLKTHPHPPSQTQDVSEETDLLSQLCAEAEQSPRFRSPQRARSDGRGARYSTAVKAQLPHFGSPQKVSTGVTGSSRSPADADEPPWLGSPQNVSQDAHGLSPAEAEHSPRFRSPQKVSRGVKGLSYSAAAAVESDDDGWHDSSDSDDDPTGPTPEPTSVATSTLPTAGRRPPVTAPVSPIAIADLSSESSTSPEAGSNGKENAAPRRKRKYELAKLVKRKSTKDGEMSLDERRARNAFLARVRRASKRGIVIEDPSQHPLKKISIQCTAAPENTYIPDLPSSLITLGMSTADARKSRNAFLARVRRHMKRGFSKPVAIEMAAKPLPGDPAYDTPVMRAQRAQMEQLQRDAAADISADSSQLGESAAGDDDARSPVWADLSG